MVIAFGLALIYLIGGISFTGQVVVFPSARRPCQVLRLLCRLSRLLCRPPLSMLSRLSPSQCLCWAWPQATWYRWRNSVSVLRRSSRRGRTVPRWEKNWGEQVYVEPWAEYRQAFFHYSFGSGRIAHDHKRLRTRDRRFYLQLVLLRAADTAGMARIKYAPNVRLIRLMCSGRLDPQFVLKALAEGADGVFISGCHPGDCHYIEQNYKTIRRYELLKKTLAQLGIEDGRVKLVWASAAEGAILADEVNKMVAEVKALGPLGWNGNSRKLDRWT